MRLRCIVLAVLPALAGGQPLSQLVDEALRNNREILAAQKKYEAARQRPSAGKQPARPDRLAGLHLQRRPWPVAGHRNATATSNAGVTVSQEMPFPGKRKLRGEIAAKEADAEFERVSARCGSAWSRASSRPTTNCTTPHVGIAFVQPLPGAAAEHPAHLRSALLGGPRRAAGHLQGADAVRHLRDRSCCATSRSAPARRSKSTRCSTGPRAAPIEVPHGNGAGRDARHARRDAGARPRARRPLIAREQKMVRAQRTGGQPGAQGLLPRLHALRRLFQPGRHAAHVAVPRGFQTAGVLLAQAARRGQRAGIRRHRSAPQLRGRGRRDCRRASASSTAWPRRRASWWTFIEKSVIPEAQLALESSLASYETGRARFSFRCFRIS